jgi:F-type H+-transporting ATPase subunit b
VRKRVLLAGLVLAAIVALGFTGSAPAGAQSDKLSKDTKECIEQAEKKDDPAACNEAPKPILPATNELVWGAISFVLVFLLLWKFAWPGLKSGMDARAQRIKGDLDEAESAKTDAETVLGEYRAQLADAKSESGRIIEEARQTADAMKRELQSQTQAEITEMRQRAAADIEAAKTQAIADLRNEVASLAIGAAEKVVGHNLDHETNLALVEQFIAEVGAR